MKKLTLIFALLITVCSHAHQWEKRSLQELKKNLHRLSPNSLNRFAKIKYSQFGEDGIIEEVFARIGIQKGFFVEFGGADGVFVSNTRYLREKGWEGVFIEADTKLFKKLQRNYKNDSKVQTFQYFVGWGKQGTTFDKIKNRHFPKRDIDFLSIDIDGGDIYVLKSLKCRPKVICIENNLFWHPLCKKEVAEPIAVQNRHQPLYVLIEAARKMGYEPVCMTINLFLVRKDLMGHFRKVPNDTLTLWKDAFRALPVKEYFIKRRANDPSHLEIEGEEINQQMPITLDF